MHHNCQKRKYPWFRETIDMNPYTYMPGTRFIAKRPKFEKYKENVSLDIDTKRAALKASSSVVALLSYTGEQVLSECCGVILENDGNNGHIVLTSAKLIRRPTEENVLENHLAQSLKSGSSIPAARLRQVDDFISVNPAEEKSFHLRPHSSHINLVPGHPIIALGRYFENAFDLVAALGEYIITRRCDDFDCKELLMGTCMITECGEGGPLINLSGEVIGISFYDTGFTPFLPINMAQKCWEHYKRYGGLRRPTLGIEATNLWAVDISHIEGVIRKIPSICNGVLVEKVIEGSSLESAGLHENDVIV